jgi:hypothetical protein
MLLVHGAATRWLADINRVTTALLHGTLAMTYGLELFGVSATDVH